MLVRLAGQLNELKQSFIGAHFEGGSVEACISKVVTSLNASILYVSRGQSEHAIAQTLFLQGAGTAFALNERDLQLEFLNQMTSAINFRMIATALEKKHHELS